VPQAMDSLPPPAVEWRRESDDERKARLEKAGVLSEQPAAQGRTNSIENSQLPAKGWVPQKLNQQAQAQKEQSKKSAVIWWGCDAGRWYSLKSPRDTSTVTDGSFGLSVELTHPGWIVAGAQFGFGPRVVFFNGGQYAKLQDGIFEGTGYADFSASELGAAASLSNRSNESSTDSLSARWSVSALYLPVRWISASGSTVGNMITRSDTHSKTAVNLPGFGVQLSAGFDWNSLLRVEAFSGVQAAWPVQYRLRVGVQTSMGLTSNALPLLAN